MSANHKPGSIRGAHLVANCTITYRWHGLIAAVLVAQDVSYVMR